MNHKKQLKYFPKEEQPYEKMLSKGAGALTDAELLAVLLRNGIQGQNALDVARTLLAQKSDGLIGILQLQLSDLTSIKGIGEVKALQILAILELARRLAKQEAGKKLDFSSPASVADYYMEDMRHLKQEKLVLVMLNGKNKLIGDKVLFIGTVNQSIVNPREIFVEALKSEAVNIILLHNHPSGDTTPSTSDLLITRKIRELGELIGIHLIDHIIIGNRSYRSLCTEEP